MKKESVKPNREYRNSVFVPLFSENGEKYIKQELALHQKLKETHTPQDKSLIENAIKALDAQIDKLVYKIYGLTEEEIKLLIIK